MTCNVAATGWALAASTPARSGNASRKPVGRPRTRGNNFAGGEIDKDKALWTIPPERMKGKVEHRVPLSLAALAVLDAVKRRVDNPYVFPGQSGKPITETSLRNILRKLGYTKDAASLHGFRSTFKDWCAEREVDDNVSEACLAHLVGDAVVRAYRRTTFFEMRKETMQAWGLYLS